MVGTFILGSWNSHWLNRPFRWGWTVAPHLIRHGERYGEIMSEIGLKQRILTSLVQSSGYQKPPATSALLKLSNVTGGARSHFRMKFLSAILPLRIPVYPWFLDLHSILFQGHLRLWPSPGSPAKLQAFRCLGAPAWRIDARKVVQGPCDIEGLVPICPNPLGEKMGTLRHTKYIQW